MNAREQAFPAVLQGMQEGWRKKRHALKPFQNQLLVRETLQDCHVTESIRTMDCNSMTTVHNRIAPLVCRRPSIRGRSRKFVMAINTFGARADA